MSLEVDFKSELSSVCFVTALKGAPERLLLYVYLHVIIQMAFRHEGLVAAFVGARKGPR
jgi:hypothetical protein